MRIDCFKAYDVRGRIPSEINDEIAYRIGNAMADYLSAKSVVICRDIRQSSESIASAVARGLTEAGSDVIDVGLGGTEMVYFATGRLGVDGGVMVTASHNPADYNGMKMVRAGSRPISADTGLKDIRALAEADARKRADSPGRVQQGDIWSDYIEHLMTYVDVAALKPLKLVVNAGNGGAGLVVDRLESRLPFEFIKVHHEPDGSFPNGVPNPMLEENRETTARAVVEHGADFGIAWDGDFDRCFFFDETGRFIEGYYMVGLLAERGLARAPGANIVYDPRVTWNTIDVVESLGGSPVLSKSGHAFIKDVMREADAIYGGEMSAHHYFREFYYCDSGMIPWLQVAQTVSETGKALSELVGERMERYPCSGEVNRQVGDTDTAIAAVRERYEQSANSVDETDGVSLEFDDWRFNLRASNTEPVIRLNVESRGDRALVDAKTAEIVSVLESL